MTAPELASFRHCYSKKDQNQAHNTIYGVMVMASLCGGEFMRTHLSPPLLSIRGEYGDENCDVASQFIQWIHRSSASS